MKISPVWHIINDCAACLIVEGGDPANIQDRFAFIDQTERIRMDHLHWAPGPYRGDWKDEAAREWCIRALRLFGHQVGKLVGVDVPLGTVGEVSSVYVGLSHAGSHISAALSSFRAAEIDVDRQRSLGQALTSVRNARLSLLAAEQDVLKFAHRFEGE